MRFAGMPNLPTSAGHPNGRNGNSSRSPGDRGTHHRQHGGRMQRSAKMSSSSVREKPIVGIERPTGEGDRGRDEAEQLGRAGGRTSMSKTSIALNNLRAIVILIVLAFHSVLAYLRFLGPDPFPFDSPP